MSMIECACGCESKFEQFDSRGRERKFWTGHNLKNKGSMSFETKKKLSYSKRDKWLAKFPNGEKVCSDCGESKSLDLYRRPSESSTRWNTRCDVCQPRYNSITWISRKYGVDFEAATDLFDQKVCEICGNEEATHVDHDHETGEIRGKLCQGCNTGIGFMKDNPDVLLAAAAYILKNQDVLATLGRES